MSVDNIKTDLLTSTKVGSNKEKKLHENIFTLKKQTTILETNLNDHEEVIASKLFFFYFLKNLKILKIFRIKERKFRTQNFCFDVGATFMFKGRCPQTI